MKGAGQVRHKLDAIRDANTEGVPNHTLLHLVVEMLMCSSMIESIG